MDSRKTARQGLGMRGEQLAADFLREKGYRIVATDYRSGNDARRGDIDIIAEQETPEGKCLVFVEVRTRRGDRYGTPEESLGAAKQARMIKLATHYLDSHDLPLETPARIDVIVLAMSAQGKLERIDHYENAVEAE